MPTAIVRSEIQPTQPDRQQTKGLIIVLPNGKVVT